MLENMVGVNELYSWRFIGTCIRFLIALVDCITPGHFGYLCCRVLVCSMIYKSAISAEQNFLSLFSQYEHAAQSSMLHSLSPIAKVQIILMSIDMRFVGLHFMI